MAELIHHAQRQPHRQNLCVMSEEVRPVVVLVDDDAAFLQAATRWLEKENFVIRTFATAAACLEGLERTLPDVLCLDIQMPDLDGMEALERVLSVHPDLPVLMLTAETSVLTVVEAMKRGAYDYLSKPLDRTRLVTAIRNAAERHQLALRLVELEREARGGTFDGIIGRSTAMRGLFRQLDRVARADISVLIHGESGTGKELVAAALHQRSARSKGPFVAINCAAIPESLQESELFGHEKGAFTGALTRHLGRFEQANGGTLFLDEVGELSLGLQAKLLRVLQERRFHRVGGAAETHSDFRVVAASHKDLRDEVAAHRFREDLYFRLAVFDLEVPPLREREGDIPILTAYLLDQRPSRSSGDRRRSTARSWRFLPPTLGRATCGSCRTPSCARLSRRRRRCNARTCQRICGRFAWTAPIRRRRPRQPPRRCWTPRSRCRRSPNWNGTPSRWPGSRPTATLRRCRTCCKLGGPRRIAS